MYATLETYEQHDPQCQNDYPMRENYEEVEKPKKKTLYVDTPELRRKRRGGMGIDSLLKTDTRENYSLSPLKTEKKKKKMEAAVCQPYDPVLPYRYMFDPHYNKWPYDPDYKVVDGEDDGRQYLNVPAYSYPDAGSSTRVMYCDAPPKIWELCDDAY